MGHPCRKSSGAKCPAEEDAMCSRCVRFAEKIRIQTPGQYFDLFQEVKEVLAQETLVLIGGNVDVADISPAEGWPDDYIEHTFQCSECGQRFRLSVETYHGSGGHWQPIDEVVPKD
jgi:hypothetical protein